MRVFLAAVLTAIALTGGARVSAQPDGLSLLVSRLDEAIRTGDAAKLQELVVPGALKESARFEALMRGPRTGVVVRERDRITREESKTVELLVETFVERGSHGQIATWRIDATPSPVEWKITAIRELSAIDGLYRLSLSSKHFEARNLTIKSEDLTLHLRSGSVFTAETPAGVTGVVLVGKGEMTFTPPHEAERAQVRIFSGEPALRVPFEEAFVRLNPNEFDRRLNTDGLIERPADDGARRRGQSVFDAFVNRTYSLDLQDLSRERWSLVPAHGDLVAEIRTKKFGNLTYAMAGNEAEDISLFHRETRRNISVYPSSEQLTQRGRFYSEDDLTDYDVEHYDVDVRITPAREWIEGTARLRAKIRSFATSTMTLRLAEPLVVRSVAARGHGRLMHLRVIGQNNLIVSLPKPAARGDVIELEVRYGGRLEPQLLDREAITVTPQQEFEPLVIPPEPRWIYSNRSYWHPQSPVTDFATATLRITIPQPHDVIATGLQTSGPLPAPETPAGPPARVWTFESTQPVRYLSAVVSKFTPVVSKPIAGGENTLNVITSPRQTSRGRAIAQQAEEIFSFYRSLAGGAPYPQLTIAVSETDLPGGHSPAYFVLLNQQLPSSQLSYRSDPVSFENYPAFFIAHEIAHQWWGQAVGWKNYHEQWISEGFAQYFAALYAGEQRGPAAQQSIMRQMRRWALDKSGEGPIHLGYRLGHIKGDSRVFRAIIYNKSAVVLHMLRRLVGDERFFAGVRRFYQQSKFTKAGTNDFRRVMEDETGMNLERFFERWVFGFGVPSVKVTHRVEETPGGEASVIVRAEQSSANIYDLPIAVSVELGDGSTRTGMLALTDATGELRIPLGSASPRIKRVVIDSDHSALARFVK